MITREILNRFFEGKASQKEEHAIRKWLDTNTEHRRLFMKQRLVYDAVLLSNSSKKSLKKRPLSARIAAYRSAAAILLLIIVSSLYAINIIRERKLSTQYNTLIVPAGQRMNLILSDNSNVWLNAKTRFRYPSKFGKKNRTVYLDGEAYFDVSKNKKAPFVVKTHKGDIRVTGTSFNIEAYSSHNTFNTSLFEGGVDIYRNNRKLASLKPHEKSTLEKEKLYISTITDTDEYLWRQGLIAFNNKKLEEIITSLEKYFDIKIEMNPEKLPKHTYTGKFRQSDGVDYALRVLQKSIHFQYKRDDEKQIIYIQ